MTLSCDNAFKKRTYGPGIVVIEVESVSQGRALLNSPFKEKVQFST